MIVAAHEVLESALKVTGVDFKDTLLDSIEPRRRGELVGFKVTATGVADPVRLYVDSAPAPDGPALQNVLALADPRSGNQRRVWAYPYDPDLPGLALLLDPAQCPQVLTKLGFRESTPRIEVEQYIPGVRAIIKIHDDDEPEADPNIEVPRAEVRFMIINPARVDLVRQVTSDFLQAGVLVPRILAHDPRGILVCEVPHGVPLSQVLPDVLGDSDLHNQLVTTLETIGNISTHVKAAAGPLERVGWYTATISELRPDWQPRLVTLSKRIASVLKEAEHADITRHGHITIDALIVSKQRPHRLMCLRSVDRAGAGSMNADSAGLYANLLVRAIRAQARGDEAGHLVVMVYADQMRQHFRPCMGAVAAYLLVAALKHVTRESPEHHILAEAMIQVAENSVQ